MTANAIGNIKQINKYCGSKYIIFGSGSRNLSKFLSEPFYADSLSILKEKTEQFFFIVYRYYLKKTFS